MTDDTNATPVDAPQAPVSDGSWDEVVQHIKELGDSIGRWAITAVNDPEYRRHANELKGHLENIAGTVTDAVDDAAASELGQSVKSAASTAGGAIKDASQTVAREVSPSLAEAFRSAADGLRKAASKMDEHAAASPAPPAAPEPPDTDPAE